MSIPSIGVSGNFIEYVLTASGINSFMSNTFPPANQNSGLEPTPANFETTINNSLLDDS